MQPFIHLHVHSQYSILDGQASIPALVDKAIRDGMKGLALTDHGNMFGIKEFFNLVKKKNGATKDAIKGVQKRIEAIESGAEEVEDKEKELASLQEEKAKLEAKIFKPIFGCEMYVAGLPTKKPHRGKYVLPSLTRSRAFLFVGEPSTRVVITWLSLQRT